MSTQTDTFRGEPCGFENCRSRAFHVDSDGRTYCHRGHQVEGQILTQTEDFGPGGSQRPGASKRTKKRDSQEREKVSLTLTGTKAIELYLQCFQLVLWKQVSWLVKEKRYPDELQPLVRELWALRLSMLSHLLDLPNEDAEAQMFSTQSDAEASDDERGRSSTRAARANFGSKLPKLLETLALIYVALILMRLPICASEIREWVLREDFAFLKADQDVGRTMMQKLPTQMRQQFAPRTGLGALERLHLTIQDTMSVLASQFSMTIPPINHKLLLFKWTAELSLPLDVFPAVDRLRNLLNLDFTFPTNQRVTHLSEHPEIRLLALLIIVVKLFYPFDTFIRHPTSVTEPAATVINWDVWNGAHARFAEQPKARRLKSHERYLDTTEDDVMTMSERDLDGFMDWFGRTYIGEQHEELGRDADFRRAVNGMFPVDVGCAEEDGVGEGMDEETRDRVGRLGEVLAGLDVRKVVSGPEKDEGTKAQILRPGERYKQWRSEADMPERAEFFVRAAADLVNLSVSATVTAVFQIERRLQVWDAEQRKTDKGKQRASFAGDDYMSERQELESAMDLD